ncbi:MAG: SAF domain-containing protein, partial [Actinomycetota bacterium]|nr:SAF domain-containing protein [Actinomycetota bacterium]
DRSLAPVVNLPAGTILKREMLTVKKPGTGIAPRDVERVVGKRLVRPVGSNRLLTWGDLGE